ncbi:MAG: hypothetical protein JXQ75_22435 [Phycisphaerae bacterium]|nr:hypothetical protein [Phycisphaerae bacterium]
MARTQPAAQETTPVKDMFALIGLISSLFASLEIRLDEYIHGLIDGDHPDTGQVVTARMNSFPAKVDLLKRLVLNRLEYCFPPGGIPNEEMAKIRKLCKTLQNACDKRNDVVHSSCQGIHGDVKTFQQRWSPGRKRKKEWHGQTLDLHGSGPLDLEELKTVRDIQERAEYALIVFMMEFYRTVEPNC